METFAGIAQTHSKESGVISGLLPTRFMCLNFLYVVQSTFASASRSWFYLTSTSDHTR